MLATVFLAVATAAAQPDRAIDVPYLAQRERLCGGAAAAMVMRYWGDAHASPAEFAPLVDTRAGGIVTTALVQALSDRGWRVEAATGTLDLVERQIADGRPVIVLLAEGRARYHYVVVVGRTERTFVVHDPSRGPARAIDNATFMRRWGPAGQWALLILPPTTWHPGTLGSDRRTAGGSLRLEHEDSTACDATLTHAIHEIVEIGGRGLEQADAILQDVRARCPSSPGPYRELAGVRFAEHRWRDAAVQAREALAREPHDEYTLDLLGSSLFMQNDEVAALRAWNEMDAPRLDLIHIQGLHRTHYQTVTELIGLQPNMLITADRFALAQRRLEELPDRSASRLALRPRGDGYASVDIAMVERTTAPRGVAEWTGLAANAAIERTIDVSSPGFGGQGETWSARWRWWNSRPAASLSFAAPRPAGLPGVWRVDGSWDAETYSQASTAAGLVRLSRSHAGLSVADWLSRNLKYSLSSGYDSWSSGHRAAPVGASLERRWRQDKIAVEGAVTRWVSTDSGPSFGLMRGRATVQTATGSDPLRIMATAGIERVSDSAPLDIWPGAGEGIARAPLARAHPLISNGIINLDPKTLFGRSLETVTVEAQRWLRGPAFARIGVAAFEDIARVSRSSIGVAGTPGTPVTLDRTRTDVGAGIRIRVPGARRIVRIDFAHGLRDGTNAVTAGVY